MIWPISVSAGTYRFYPKNTELTLNCFFYKKSRLIKANNYRNIGIVVLFRRRVESWKLETSILTRYLEIYVTKKIIQKVKYVLIIFARNLF